MLTITSTSPTDIPESHLVLTPGVEVYQEHHSHFTLFRGSDPLFPRLLGQKGMQNLTRLGHTFWNEIILDEIIEDHILKSRELRVHITRAPCTPTPSGYTCSHVTPSRIPLLVCVTVQVVL
jgi:hypothetical protein